MLTTRLAELAAKVVAIEIDPALADAIEKLTLPNVEVLRGNAVQVAWPVFTKCVSNLPYQISSPFLFRLLDVLEIGGTLTPGFPKPPPRAVLMVQKEFADRLVAKPGGGDYGRLSVSAQRRAEVEIVARVPPGAFDPPPQVESAIVRIRPRPAPFDVPANYDAVVERAFAQRRKKLANSLGRKDLPHADRRPEELTPAQFADVARAWGRGSGKPRAGVSPASPVEEEGDP